jgi:hypothetical protein
MPTYSKRSVKMKKLKIAIMMVAILLTGSVAFADITLKGFVTDIHGRAIQGARIDFYHIEGVITVYSAADGSYDLYSDRNWCGEKLTKVSRTGYFDRNYGVRDDSCCSCCGYEYPNCCIPPHNDGNTCKDIMWKNFTLLCFDGDSDGVCNSLDNCPSKANGPERGTCDGGSNDGLACTIQRQCKGCLASCSMDQEDSDGDGIGNVCDSSPFQASALEAPSFYLACAMNEDFNKAFPYLCNPELEGATDTDLTQGKLIVSTSSRLHSEVLLVALGFLPQIFCWRNEGCNEWGCIEQLVADILNGPESFLGFPIDPDKPPLPECPDRMTIGEAVTEFMKWLFELRFGYPPCVGDCESE